MIHTYFDLCTSHVSQATMQQIQETGDQQRLGKPGPYYWPAMSIGVYPYGAFVTVPEPDRLDELPTDLAAVMRLAQQLNVTVVRLDRDAPELAGLQSYRWEGEDTDESEVLRLRDQAQTIYGQSDNVAIEDDALVDTSPANGAWVAARVWVDKQD